MASDKKHRRLQELRGSNFELSKGQPDIRGWEVKDANGHKLGKVHELIFDVHARKVRYIVADIADSKELQLEKRRVMVPIGLAELHRADDDVILHNITPFQLRALPRYDKEDLGIKAERAISTVFGRSFTSIGDDAAQTDSSNEFYEHDHFNENNLYRNRQSRSADHSSQSERKHQHSPEHNLTEAEASSLRRDAELGRPVSNLGTMDDLNKNNGSSAPGKETDEEYIRRARKNIDNRNK